MSDIFLVLAQTEEGLSCFLLPRILPDGSRNAFHIQRLKDKLGNHSNASSEIELHGAWARMVGEPGRGVPTIIEMVGHTRLDCVIGTAAGMRAGVVNATHHAAHRQAFGKMLIDQPLMRNVLADLCLESEATTALAMRLARAYDEAHADAQAGEDSTDAQLFKRLATAVGKYWTCKRAPNHACEALECLGGNGYVEESGMPRLYREAPLASIWEGSGNVMSLDVLRALTRTPRSLEVFLDEVQQAQGGDARLDARVEKLKGQFADPATLETRARRVVEGMALCLQGSLLVRHAPPAVADAFCASRWPATAVSSTARCRPAATSRASSPAAARSNRPRHARPPRRETTGTLGPAAYHSEDGPAHELPARTNLRDTHRGERQLVLRPLLSHLLPVRSTSTKCSAGRRPPPMPWRWAARWGTSSRSSCTSSDTRSWHAGWAFRSPASTCGSSEGSPRCGVSRRPRARN